MWTEDDIKRLKQQEQDMLRQVGKAPRDEAKAIKAAKAAEKTPAKMNRAALKANERAARYQASTERRDALKEWDARVANANAARKAEKDAVKAAKKQRWQGQPDTWQATKDTWQDAPAKGKWQREPVYYVDDYQQRRGCGCFSFGFSAAGVLLLLILLLLAQLAS
mgnify:FL=1|jgi:hypothetical protein